MTDKTVHDDTTRLAIIETKVDGLVGAVGDIKASLNTSTTTHVTRAEWELRNKLVDERHEAMMRKQAPWWSAAAVVIAGAAFLWAVLGDSITQAAQR